MAPEIINKEPYDPKKGDLFACGVVLFHLVMGFLPFVAACPKDRSYNKIISRDFKGFWEIHEASHHSISNKNFSSFKDLFIKMVHPEVEERLTLEEIKEHEWFNACTIEGDELIASMKVRSKAALDSTELFPNEEFHFHNFIILQIFPLELIKARFQWYLIKLETKSGLLLQLIISSIPNDDIVPPKKSKKKGLQLKKYSEYFMSETGKTLLSAIISFAEAQGLCYTEDSTHSAVLLESQTDDENVSIKANVVDNPSCQSQ